NDGGGSIRIPASCSGLVGLKPSRGRVPAVVPGWMGASVEGVVTRTVADTAGVLDQICGPDRLGWQNAPAPDRPFAAEVGADPGRLRIAVLTTAPFGLPLADDPAAAVHRAARVLDGLGHHVDVVDFDLVPLDLLATFLPVVNAGFADFGDIDVDRMEPHNRAAYAAGQSVDSITFVRALGDLQRFSRDLVARWGRDFDVLVTPTMAILPPVAGSVLAQCHAAPADMPGDVLSMAALTAPFNVTGQPAVSIPLHHTGPDLDLPVGVQLVAGPWQEAVLLRVAAQLELAEQWRDRRPPGR